MTTSKERFKVVVDVSVFLRRADGYLLLLRRAGTGYADGQLCGVAGHLEEGETVVDGAIREAREEVGVVIEPPNLQFVHVMHWRSDQSEAPRVGFFFVCDKWSGEPINAEPHKCAELMWVSPDEDLPSDMVSYSAAALAAMAADSSPVFSVAGQW